MVEEFNKKGIHVLNWYWTLGRYDTVLIFEAASEKEVTKISIDVSEWVTSETLVAIPRAEAVKLLEIETSQFSSLFHFSKFPVLKRENCVGDTDIQNGAVTSGNSLQPQLFAAMCAVHI